MRKIHNLNQNGVNNESVRINDSSYVIFAKKNSITGKYEIANKNKKGDWYIPNKNSDRSGSFTISAPNNYVFDKALADQMDARRNRVFTYNADGTITFNFNNLPSDGSLDGPKGMDNYGNPLSEAFQLWVKPITQTKTYEMHSVNTHTYEGMIDWFDEGNGDYIGTTIVDDYSMGLGEQEIRRANHDGLTIGLNKEANIESTRYIIQIPSGYTIYSTYSNKQDIAKKDGTYGTNGYLSWNQSKNTVTWDADGQANNAGEWINDPSDSGKVGKFFHLRAYLKRTLGTDHSIPSIKKSVGYSNKNNIPFFVEYQDDDINKKIGIASFTGSLNKTYSEAELTNGLNSANLSKSIITSVDPTKVIKLPQGYILRKWNYNSGYKGDHAQLDNWVNNFTFVNDKSYLENRWSGNPEAPFYNNNAGVINIAVRKSTSTNTFNYISQKYNPTYSVKETVKDEQGHIITTINANLDQPNEKVLIDDASRLAISKGGIKTSQWNQGSLAYYYTIAPSTVPITFNSYSVPSRYKIKSIKDITNNVNIPIDSCVDKTNKKIINNISILNKNGKPRNIEITLETDIQTQTKSVTRTIKYDVPTGQAAVPDVIQKVTYTETGVENASGTGIDWNNDWKLKEGSDKDWAEHDIKQINGYISFINGQPATKVEEVKNVASNGKDVTLTVSYRKSQSNENPSVIIEPNVPSSDISVSRNISTSSPNNESASSNESVVHVRRVDKYIVLTHNAFLYTLKDKIIIRHGRIIIWHRGRIIHPMSNKIVTIKGKKFYQVKKYGYVKVSNTVIRKLRTFKLLYDAVVYDHKGHPIIINNQKQILRENTHIKVWNNGVGVKIKRRNYYQIGRNKFILAARTIPQERSAYKKINQ